MALDVDARIALLEKIAQDEDVKMTQRLRALEEIGRLEARRNSAAGKADTQDENELAPDPFADLDEMEAQRQKRRRRAAG